MTSQGQTEGALAKDIDQFIIYTIFLFTLINSKGSLHQWKCPPHFWATRGRVLARWEQGKAGGPGAARTPSLWTTQVTQRHQQSRLLP